MRSPVNSAMPEHGCSRLGVPAGSDFGPRKTSKDLRNPPSARALARNSEELQGAPRTSKDSRDIQGPPRTPETSRELREFRRSPGTSWDIQGTPEAPKTSKAQGPKPHLTPPLQLCRTKRPGRRGTLSISSIASRYATCTAFRHISCGIWPTPCPSTDFGESL